MSLPVARPFRVILRRRRGDCGVNVGMGDMPRPKIDMAVIPEAASILHTSPRRVQNFLV